MGLTKASIVYGRTEEPENTQVYVWEQYDLFPRFPELRRFLDSLERELGATILHSVEVFHECLGRPTPMPSLVRIRHR